MQKSQRFTEPAAATVPGFTLSEVIAQFYAEGVVPDFIPADLGEDLVGEVDADGGNRASEGLESCQAVRGDE